MSFYCCYIVILEARCGQMSMTFGVYKFFKSSHNSLFWASCWCLQFDLCEIESWRFIWFSLIECSSHSWFLLIKDQRKVKCHWIEGQRKFGFEWTPSLSTWSRRRRYLQGISFVLPWMFCGRGEKVEERLNMTFLIMWHVRGRLALVREVKELVNGTQGNNNLVRTGTRSARPACSSYVQYSRVLRRLVICHSLELHKVAS